MAPAHARHSRRHLLLLLVCAGIVVIHALFSTAATHRSVSVTATAGPSSRTSTADPFATLTLPPLIRFGSLEAGPAPEPTTTTTQRQPDPSKTPLAADRVRACMDRCEDAHMVNAQARTNCLESCLKQRNVPNTVVPVKPAGQDVGQGVATADGKGNTSAAMPGGGERVLVLTWTVLASVIGTCTLWFM